VADAESRELFRDYRNGDDAAATAIFDRYVTRLEALARTRLGHSIKRRVDPEDVVQSAFRSFFIHARESEFALKAKGDLWRLLAAITLNKLHGQVEKQSAQKRSARRELADASDLLRQIESPSSADVVAVCEEFHLALRSLSPIEQRALALELEGQSLDKISRALGKSSRSTRRYLADAREKIERRLSPVHQSRPLVEGAPHTPLRYSDYVLERMLGVGGMGKVYRAREKCLGNVVALKSLHKAQLVDPRAVEKFLQEAQILTRLRHPNIVRIHGLGRYPGGGYFIAMQMIDGVDLETVRTQRKFSAWEIASVGSQVTAAIHHAHAHGIVHCDVKPANILLDQHGQIFITDFGFAHLMGPEISARGVGGTVGYAAPEVLQGADPTPAADIYAIGMLLRVLATGSLNGELPIDADEPQKQLEAIWRHCLQFVPAARYHAVQLMAGLERIGQERNAT
jgi:DNA-directed RNA polymerase specialized sigma24 family protein